MRGLSSGFILSMFLIGGCATKPPVQEYTLARTALEAARDQDAARFAPSHWHRAEEAYRRAETFFRENDFKDAEEQFVLAREFAEKAENVTRVQRSKTGEF